MWHRVQPQARCEEKRTNKMGKQFSAGDKNTVVSRVRGLS